MMMTMMIVVKMCVVFAILMFVLGGGLGCVWDVYFFVCFFENKFVVFQMDLQSSLPEMLWKSQNKAIKIKGTICNTNFSQEKWPHIFNPSFWKRFLFVVWHVRVGGGVGVRVGGGRCGGDEGMISGRSLCGV